jgi:hypothetical protein
MATLTELVAAVAVHSSAVALSHFGVTLAPTPAAGPAQSAPVAERVVARTPRTGEKLLNCAKPRPAGGLLHA